VLLRKQQHCCICDAPSTPTVEFSAVTRASPAHLALLRS